MFPSALLSLVNGYNFTLESNTYYNGTILLMYNNSCLDNCQSICNIDSSCSGFMLTRSTLSNQTQCITMTVLTSSLFNTLYHTYTKQYNYTFENSVNYPASDIKHFMPTTVTACQNYCNQYSNCVAFVFRKYPIANDCWIKHTLIDGSKITDGYWNAYIRQYEPNSTFILTCSTTSDILEYPSILTSQVQASPVSDINSIIITRNPKIVVAEITIVNIILIFLRVVIDSGLFVIVLLKTPFKREFKKKWTATTSKSHFYNTGHVNK